MVCLQATSRWACRPTKIFHLVSSLLVQRAPRPLRLAVLIVEASPGSDSVACCSVGLQADLCSVKTYWPCDSPVGSSSRSERRVWGLGLGMMLYGCREASSRAQKLL